MNTICCDAGCTARVAGTESEISLPGAGEGAAGQLSVDEDEARWDARRRAGFNASVIRIVCGRINVLWSLCKGPFGMPWLLESRHGG